MEGIVKIEQKLEGRHDGVEDTRHVVEPDGDAEGGEDLHEQSEVVLVELRGVHSPTVPCVILPLVE